jgi:hypothetical protein
VDTLGVKCTFPFLFFFFGKFYCFNFRVIRKLGLEISFTKKKKIQTVRLSFRVLVVIKRPVSLKDTYLWRRKSTPFQTFSMSNAYTEKSLKSLELFS